MSVQDELAVAAKDYVKVIEDIFRIEVEILALRTRLDNAQKHRDELAGKLLKSVGANVTSRAWMVGAKCVIAEFERGVRIILPEICEGDDE